MRKSSWIYSLFFLGIFLYLTSEVYARVGVGVGSGKIVVDEKIRPGVLYDLPPLTVFNTGDETSEYEVGVEYHQDQPELMPKREWFSFSPDKFELDPGESQVVAMRLNMPFKAEPGKYFAYIEGRPLKKSVEGETAVSIAAATKLYFEVEPANMVLGAYYRAKSIWLLYSPWVQIATGAVGVYILISIFKRFVNIDVKLSATKKRDKSEIDDE